LTDAPGRRGYDAQDRKRRNGKDKMTSPCDHGWLMGER
jgi:hypothetical protein